MNLDRSNSRWKARFRLPRIAWSTLARNRRDRAIIGRTSANGIRQVYNWRPDTGVSEPITSRASGVANAVVSPDGEHVYYLCDDQGNEIGGIGRVPWVGGVEELVTPGLPTFSLVGDPSFSGNGRFLGFTYGEEEQFSACLVDLQAPGFDRRILRTSGHLVTMPILSEDGKLAVVGTTERRPDRLDLEAYETDGLRLVAKLEGTDRGSSYFHSFCPVPGVQQMLGVQEEGAFTKPFVWDIETQTADDPIGCELEGDVIPLDWATRETMLLARYWKGEEQLYLYGGTDGSLSRIEHRPGAFSFVGRGGAYLSHDTVSVTYQNFAQNSKVVSVSTSTGSMSDELVLGEHSEDVECSSVTFRSSDGTPVQSWLAVPPGPGPHPLIISLHGGPRMVSKSAFSPDALCFLDHGFAHMSINYRGSTTFGKDFSARIVGKVGEWECEDVLAAREWAISEGITGRDQVLLNGSSYGGYLVLYCLAVHPGLWAGGIARNAIADWTLMYEDATTSMKGYASSLFSGTPREQADRFVKSSPSTYADRIEEPLLVFQSLRDSRVPPRQMRAFEKRMAEMEKPFEIHWLDSGHLGSQGDLDERIRQQEIILEFCLNAVR